MGKLNIAHHKSYHPYRLDNIERVRRDEEAARLKAEGEEDRMRVADAEARMDALRKRAGVSGTSVELEGALVVTEPSAGPSTGRDEADRLTTARGHINLFADIEQQSISEALRKVKKSVPAETEKGVPLAPSEKDLNPWYSDKSGKGKEVDDGRRTRDLARQSRDDPLTFINSQLSSSSTSSSRSKPPPRRARQRRSPSPSMPPPKSSPLSLQESRLSRESSERQRALALIARKKREMAGSETPSTVYDEDRTTYGDQYNRQEVREAQRERGRGNRGIRDRRW
ncbi:hypothetical protein GLOTRDRAFT_65874 [Gloeophyllum trabeum ATCC 11539]|uniref:CBF1-interacting co-repressor CIR N-terminal domain-containing protein n=1 Tax=Gloeophyllum trabeum (strain ATCC 11539 / FP-39264 / Madison 617) TaxID=670483 RepID=S7RBP5_GLOTA|nr:uncharacterized protein GLOTRDRAFT_65874 [Gloeophyllum trabeum ATCC 11539]EPQ51670.1 hypothetical protein GLOTRDRAFT_65874 [Gloeophyllum trabeum ATCC 11539]